MFHVNALLRNDKHVPTEPEFSGERVRRGWEVGGLGGSRVHLSRACPGSRARQEALERIAQEWRRPEGLGGNGRGRTLAALVLPLFPPLAQRDVPDVDTQKPPACRDPGVQAHGT